MNDLVQFERLIADVAAEAAGPSRPVDVAAITRAASTQSPQWRVQPMFSASKFVAAGAIVALVGGFLLAGVLTTQRGDEMAPAAVSPSPTSTEELLSGMVTEEVEPGVLQVLSDGAGHDLVADPPVGLTVGPDGEVVLFLASADPRQPDVVSSVYVLGDEGTEPLPGDGDSFWMDSAVDEDGVLWTFLGQSSNGGRLGRFDGSTWTMPTWPNGSGQVHAIESTTDGAVWVTLAGNSSASPKVARVKDGVWTLLPPIVDGSITSSNDDITASYIANDSSFEGYASDFAAAPDGTAWLAKGDGAGKKLRTGTAGLLHFDGEIWQVVDLPIDPSMNYVGPLALGPDGTLWVYAATKPSGRSVPELARLQDGQWIVFTEADGVPALVRWQTSEANFAVDAQGTLWIAFDGDPVGPVSLPPPLGPSDPPHGVLSFDGSTWRQYLRGHAVNQIAVGPDGTVWATSHCEGWVGCPDNPGHGGFFVITPEAAMATR